MHWRHHWPVRLPTCSDTTLGLPPPKFVHYLDQKKLLFVFCFPFERFFFNEISKVGSLRQLAQQAVPGQLPTGLTFPAPPRRTTKHCQARWGSTQWVPGFPRAFAQLDVPGTPLEVFLEAYWLDAQPTSTGSFWCQRAAALFQAPPVCLSSSVHL